MKQHTLDEKYLAETFKRIYIDAYNRGVSHSLLKKVWKPDELELYAIGYGYGQTMVIEDAEKPKEQHFEITFEYRDDYVGINGIRKVVYKAETPEEAKEEFERDWYRNITMLDIKRI